MYIGQFEDEGKTEFDKLQSLENLKARAWQEVQESTPENVRNITIATFGLFFAIYWFLIRTR